MTTPTDETRDHDRADREPERRPRLDLSVTKVAAGACASALAAAVGSKLGVGGTIAGAAVASVVATSASAVIGHSLERGKTAACTVIPALDPEQLETAFLARARTARAAHRTPAAAPSRRRVSIRGPDPHRRSGAIDPLRRGAGEDSLTDRALTDSGLDETVVLDGGTHAALGRPDPMGPHAQTMLLANAASDAPRTWKDRLPGRKPLLAAVVASFVLGTSAVTALEVARKGEFPGYHSNVFSNDPGQSGGSHNPSAPKTSGAGGSDESSTPSQKPDSPSPTQSGSSDSPSATPSTPQSSDSAPTTSGISGTPGTSNTSSTSGTPSTNASTAPTGPATPPATSPTGGANPSSAPNTPGAPAPATSSTAGAPGKATGTGGGPAG